jgi:hypothetical protein
MVQIDCPWCDTTLSVDPAAVTADEGSCPECLTSWCYEDEADYELALAA